MTIVTISNDEREIETGLSAEFILIYPVSEKQEKLQLENVC